MVKFGYQTEDFTLQLRTQRRSKYPKASDESSFFCARRTARPERDWSATPSRSDNSSCCSVFQVASASQMQQGFRSRQASPNQSLAACVFPLKRRKRRAPLRFGVPPSGGNGVAYTCTKKDRLPPAKAGTPYDGASQSRPCALRDSEHRICCSGFKR